MKGKGKIKELIDELKSLSKTKVYNWNISEAKMKQTWTKDQKEYLDKEFGTLERAILANQKAIEANAEAIKANAKGIENNSKKIDLIIDILARNGMK